MLCNAWGGRNKESAVFGEEKPTAMKSLSRKEQTLCSDGRGRVKPPCTNWGVTTKHYSVFDDEGRSNTIQWWERKGQTLCNDWGVTTKHARVTDEGSPTLCIGRKNAKEYPVFCEKRTNIMQCLARKDHASFPKMTQYTVDLTRYMERCNHCPADSSTNYHQPAGQRAMEVGVLYTGYYLPHCTEILQKG